MTTPADTPRRAILISGIGATTARCLSNQGWQVALNYAAAAQREAANGIAATAGAPGQCAIAVEGDVTPARVRLAHACPIIKRQRVGQAPCLALRRSR